MIPNSQQVILQIFENDIRNITIRHSGIRQTSAIMQITSINKKKINVIVNGRLIHMPNKRRKITPVSTVVLLLDVTYKRLVSAAKHIIQLTDNKRINPLTFKPAMGV